MSNYLADLIASFLPTPEPPPTPNRLRTLTRPPAKPSRHLQATPPFGSLPTGRLRPAPVQHNHPPSHPRHRSPWQHAWARLTPNEQAWSSGS